MFDPQGHDRVPGIVLVGGSDGGELVGTARFLAAAGFPSLALTYFGAPGLPGALRDVPLEYFAQALDALRAESSTPVGPRILLGISRGTEAALLAAAHFPSEIDGVIAVVPGNVTLCSWPPGGPAWLLKGSPLPYSQRFGPRASDEAQVIPVERIRGPVLLLSAGADRVWPSTAMAAAIAGRRKERGSNAPCTHVDFPNASHALGLLAEPSSFGPNPEDRQARSRACAEILAFLRRSFDPLGAGAAVIDTARPG